MHYVIRQFFVFYIYIINILIVKRSPFFGVSYCKLHFVSISKLKNINLINSKFTNVIVTQNF